MNPNLKKFFFFIGMIWGMWLLLFIQLVFINSFLFVLEILIKG